MIDNHITTSCRHKNHKASGNLVSVIIPAYNAEKFIEETIESVLSQSYPYIEIIMVNDGSTDGTLDVVNRFNKIKHRIKIVNQKRSGVAAARNTGILHSHGDFIAPLDSDDIWYPEKISSQVKVILEKDELTGLVYTWNVTMDNQSQLISLGSTAKYEGYVFSKLLINNFIGCASVPLIRRSCLDQVGGYSTEFYLRHAQGCEDLDLHLRIAEKFKFAVVPKLLVGYRRNDACMSMDHFHMYKSFKLTIDRLYRRIGYIPKRYLNMSYGFTMLYLEGISCQSGDYLSSIYYLCVALIRCPHILCIPSLRRRYNSRLFNLIKLIKKSSKKPDHICKLHTPSKQYSLSELMELAMKRKYPENTIAALKHHVRMGMERI